MKHYKMITANLYLFGEGGSEGSATSEGTASAESSEAPAEKINPITGKPLRGEFQPVKYGKQEEAEADSEPETTEDDGAANHQEQQSTDRRKAFKDLVHGEYKDIYTEEMQKVIDKRFKETKELEAHRTKTTPLLEALATKYGIDSNDVEAITNAVNDDNALWEEAADEAGMTVEQYKQFQKLQRDSAELQRIEAERTSEERANEQLMRWNEESEALKQSFPDFDLNAEAQNPAFINLLRAGLPVEHAYKVIHMDDIVSNAMRSTASAAEKRATENIRARGTRPQENGSTSRSAFTVKNDVHNLTRADRAEIARRAARGEYIEF